VKCDPATLLRLWVAAGQPHSAGVRQLVPIWRPTTNNRHRFPHSEALVGPALPGVVSSQTPTPFDNRIQRG